jgi:release factor glutamine methyltransferase
VSEEAVAWAKRNVRAYGLANRAKIVHGDWNEAQGEFDVVLCNPPYVSEQRFASLTHDVALYEPKVALAGGTDGLAAYRQLAPLIAGRLTRRGRAFVELGKAEDVTSIFCRAGLTVWELVPDLMKIPRVLVATLPQ